MTKEERVKRMTTKYCIDDDEDDNCDVYEALPNIDELAETLVDIRVGDGDGVMTCDEFNKAYLETVPTDLCLHVSSTPYSELTESSTMADKCPYAPTSDLPESSTTSAGSVTPRRWVSPFLWAAVVFFLVALAS